MRQSPTLPRSIVTHATPEPISQGPGAATRLLLGALDAVHRAGNGPTEILDRLGPSITSLVTPFRHCRIDRPTLHALCRRQVERGTSALVVCGTSGEGVALFPTEQTDVLELAADAVGGQIPVVAGCLALATQAATTLAASALAHGAAAILCGPPPYCMPTQDGIIAHVRAVAHASDLPVILHDTPRRTGIAIADATIAKLFDRGLIVAIKDATGDLGRIARLRALCGAGLGQFSGDDATAVAHRAMGGRGCISTTANVTPALCARMHRAWDEGDTDGFTRLGDLLAELHKALSAESDPIAVKAALNAARLCEADVRLPLTRATPATVEALAPVLSVLLALEDAVPCH